MESLGNTIIAERSDGSIFFPLELWDKQKGQKGIQKLQKTEQKMLQTSTN